MPDGKEYKYWFCKKDDKNENTFIVGVLREGHYKIQHNKPIPKNKTSMYEEFKSHADTLFTKIQNKEILK